MEKYVNIETIIKNNIYETFKGYIICPICKNLILEPFMCLKCQNHFCKNCSENLDAINNNSHKCENPNYQKILGSNNMITKFKFKCIKGCGKEIPYDEINRHYNSDCSNKANKTNKIRFLSKYEVTLLDKDIEYIISKKINYYLNIYL